MENALPIDPELLACQTGWVKDLARRLVADVHLADELAQEALVAALESSSSAREAFETWDQPRLRGWLRGTLRNRVAMRFRSEGRRREREHRAARPESESEVDERLEECAVRARELIDEVMALSEPYRSAIVLRFYEGLSMAEIARKLDVSEGAVRTRLSRAYGELREALDRKHGGDRRVWALAFADWGRHGSTSNDQPEAGPASRPVNPCSTTSLGGGTAGLGIASFAILSLAALTAIALRPQVDEGRESIDLTGAATGSARDALAQGPRLDQRPDEQVRRALRVVSEREVLEAAGMSAPEGAGVGESRLSIHVVKSVRGTWWHRPMKEREGIPGATVHVRWSQFPEQSFSGITDSRGFIEDVPLPEGWRSVRGELPFEFSATAPGYLTSWGTKAYRHGAQIVGKALQPGHEWIVRVVDTAGKAVSAHVVLHSAGSGKNVVAETDGADTYRAPITTAGSFYATAVGPDVGFAVRGPFDLDVGTDVDAGALVLTEAGSLSGTVTAPDGTPLPGMEVRAYPTDLGNLKQLGIDRVPTPDGVRWSAIPAPRRLWVLGGLPWAGTETDDLGRFSLRALIPGEYELTTAGGAVRHGVFSTGASVELIDRRPVLEVRVIDTAGSPVLGAQVSVLCESTGDAAYPEQDRAGGFDVRVAPGNVWIAASAPGAPVVLEKIYLPSNEFMVAAELVLDFETQPGSLELDVVDALGGPARGFGTWIHPRALGLDFRVASFVTTADLGSLPAGDYRIGFLGEYSAAGLTYLRDEIDFTIREGEATRLTHTLRRGANLELDLRTSGKEPNPYFPPRAWLDSTDGERLGLETFYRFEPSSSREGQLEFGAGQLSEPVEPGVYTLHVEAPEFEPAIREVRLMAGETEALTVTLLPRAE